MPALLALLSSVMWGAADFLGGTLTRRAHAVAVVAASQVLSLVAVAPVRAADRGARTTPPATCRGRSRPGSIGMVSLVAFYAALADRDDGRGRADRRDRASSSRSRSGWSAATGRTLLQLVGVVLAVAGVVLASGPELRGVETGQARGGARSLCSRCCAAVGFGLVLWLLAKGGRYSVTMTLLTQRSASLVVGRGAAAHRAQRSAG